MTSSFPYLPCDSLIFQIGAIVSYNLWILILAISFRFQKDTWSQPSESRNNLGIWLLRALNLVVKEFSRLLLYKGWSDYLYVPFTYLPNPKTQEPIEIFFSFLLETFKNSYWLLSSEFSLSSSHASVKFTNSPANFFPAVLGKLSASRLLPSHAHISTTQR